MTIDGHELQWTDAQIQKYIREATQSMIDEVLYKHGDAVMMKMLKTENERLRAALEWCKPFVTGYKCGSESYLRDGNPYGIVMAEIARQALEVNRDRR